jgi:hypothetical protein
VTATIKDGSAWMRPPLDPISCPGGDVENSSDQEEQEMLMLKKSSDQEEKLLLKSRLR